MKKKQVILSVGIMLLIWFAVAPELVNATASTYFTYSDTGAGGVLASNITYDFNYSFNSETKQYEGFLVS